MEGRELAPEDKDQGHTLQTRSLPAAALPPRGTPLLPLLLKASCMYPICKCSGKTGHPRWLLGTEVATVQGLSGLAFGKGVPPGLTVNNILEEGERTRVISQPFSAFPRHLTSSLQNACTVQASLGFSTALPNPVQLWEQLVFPEAPEAGARAPLHVHFLLLAGP